VQYTVTGALALDRPVIGGGHCVGVRPVDLGTGRITATLDGVSRTWEVTVVEEPPAEQQSARLRPEALRWAGEAIAVGERAAAQLPVQ
jgi:hypothetical protein